MFKYCVWYCLKPNHIIHQHIRRYAQAFNTCSFPAHITVKHSLSLEEAKDLHHSMKGIPVPSFPGPSSLVSTVTKIDSIKFYAIECKIREDGAHISLAYRCAEGFSPVEVSVVSPVSIGPDDIYLCIADCSSRYPNEWKILSI